MTAIFAKHSVMTWWLVCESFVISVSQMTLHQSSQPELPGSFRWKETPLLPELSRHLWLTRVDMRIHGPFLSPRRGILLCTLILTYFQNQHSWSVAWINSLMHWMWGSSSERWEMAKWEPFCTQNTNKTLWRVNKEQSKGKNHSLSCKFMADLESDQILNQLRFSRWNAILHQKGRYESNSYYGELDSGWKFPCHHRWAVPKQRLWLSARAQNTPWRRMEWLHQRQQQGTERAPEC